MNVSCQERHIEIKAIANTTYHLCRDRVTIFSPWDQLTGDWRADQPGDAALPPWEVLN